MQHPAHDEVLRRVLGAKWNCKNVFQSQKYQWSGCPLILVPEQQNNQETKTPTLYGSRVTEDTLLVLKMIIILSRRRNHFLLLWQKAMIHYLLQEAENYSIINKH